MESVASLFARAVSAYREAVSHLEAARLRLRQGTGSPGVSPQAAAEIRWWAEQMQQQAAALTPGWLGCRLDPAAADVPTGVDAGLNAPMMLRLGDAQPAAESQFSVAVPFVGAGHLAIDRDTRDDAVARWLRGILVRTIAALPDGAVRVAPVDGATLGVVFSPFRALIDAEAWRRPAIDLPGLRVVLDEVEARIEAGAAADTDAPVLLVCVAALPEGTGRAEWSRLAAIAHAGPQVGVYLLLAGYPPPQHPGMAAATLLERTTHVIADRGDATGGPSGLFRVSNPPGPRRFDADGADLPALLRLDAGPPDELVEVVCRRLARTARAQTSTDFAALLPGEIWTESSVTGLRTVVGREGRGEAALALDDVTPHWLVGGRTGSGKTVFVLDVLYGLASRYSPDELGLYLLDFKEGVSFAEFTPTPIDPSWIPHARTVGIESDREYGLAVLRTLSREMSRRATELKRAGVTKLADLRTNRTDAAMPRLVAVIDEFHVLFAGNDAIAGQAAALLEELARKGRSYGIHLILASQTVSGIDALLNKSESIFGQFPLRVALAGGGGVLDATNDAADNLPVGTTVVNTAAGIVGANRLVRFPNADAASVSAARHRLWEARPAGNLPPAVFAGYAEQHVADDPAFERLGPEVRRRQAVVGRAVEVGLPTAGFTFDATPGRHLGVLGTSVVGADILHAATLGLARQHRPGSARFVLVSLVAAADEAADAAEEGLKAAGHACQTIASAGEYKTMLADLAKTVAGAEPGAGHQPTYLVVFGADTATSVLATKTLVDTGDPMNMTYRSGHEDLAAVLAGGPARGIHLLGWWRTVRRFTDDLGPGGSGEIACLVALNVAATEIGSLVGEFTLTWQPRPNRALLIDRHDDRRTLIVPYVRPGTLDEIEATP